MRAGRLSKAEQVLRVANDARELAGDDDAAVTLYVHAGTAASDAICASKLKKHAKGEDHRMAILLLESVDKKSSRYLSILLKMKIRAGYGHSPISDENLKSAHRAATCLVD